MADLHALDATQIALLRRGEGLPERGESGRVRDAAVWLRDTLPGPPPGRWQAPPPRPAVPPLPGGLPPPLLPRATWEAMGFVVVGPAFASAAIEILGAAADRVLDLAFASSGMEERADWVARVTQIPDPADWDPTFDALEQAPSLAALASAAIGAPGARCLWSHLVIKPPVEGAALPWHTDRPTWPFPSDVPAVALWMALDPLEADSGGLWYRPGSHRGGSDGEDPVQPRVPLGHLLIHHGSLLHCSKANRSGRWRRAWIGVFGCPPEAV